MPREKPANGRLRPNARGKERFLRRAIALSLENVRKGRGGPFAALVVKDGRVVGEGTNRVTLTNDPTAHAEIVAMRDACRALGTFELSGCEIYASCEPCPMCLGAIYWARIERVYFAASASDASRVGFDDSMILRQLRLPRSRRRVRMTQMLRAEALRAMRAWQEAADKIPY
jgi:tRNA(Arg) A34 adenosine deaminase TadA